MHLIDLVPDGEALCAMEPEELGILALPYLKALSGPMMSHLTLQAFLNNVRDHYRAPNAPEVDRALREAWAWLEGQALLIESSRFTSPNSVRVLSRKAERFAADANRAFPQRRLAKDELHPHIREDVWSLYHRGKYDSAVFEAMKRVEVAVREAAKLGPEDIGTALMRKAFNSKNGPLTDLSRVEAERQARSDLFAGAIGSYKNPQSHRHVDLADANEAAEIVMLANHLLRIVDTCQGSR